MRLLTGFVQNAALLLILALIFDLRSRGPEWTRGRRSQVVLGLLVGAAGVLTMLVPIMPEPGIVLDSRGMLLAISGLFFGPVVTVIAAAMTMAYRVFAIGGSSTATGVVFILGSSLLGLGWRVIREGKVFDLHWSEFAIIGAMVGTFQLLLTRALLGPNNSTVLLTLGLTLVLVSAAAGDDPHGPAH